MLMKTPKADTALAPTFNKDPVAEKIARLMADPEFPNLPDTYKAEQAGITVSELQKYLENPQFLRWAAERMRDYYLAQLPALLNVITQQALQGKGRQQQMLLDFMKVITKEKEETKAPNIIIVTNVPDPFKESQDDKDRVVIDLRSDADGGSASLQ